MFPIQRFFLKNKFTCLLYHDIHPELKSDIIIQVQMFREQLKFLKNTGYNFITLYQLLSFLEDGNPLPEKPVLITFDDCYKGFSSLAVPILSEFEIKASFFIPTKDVDTQNKNNGTLSYPELREIVNAGHEIALHSHSHFDFKKNSTEAITNDVLLNMHELKLNHIPFQPVLSYPFGSRPSGTANFSKMQEALSQIGIKAAFRIGNRINKIPVKNNFLLNRIDVKGTDSFALFKMKLKFGKLSL